MPANTRQAKKEQQLARLASLYATAVSLIGGGKRDQKMVDVLLEALQFFKERSLGSVVKKDELSEARQLRRAQRIEFYARYVRPWLEGKGGVAFPEIVFDFSRPICAAFFLGALPKLPMLLQKSESQFSPLPASQAVLQELREKLAPYGLHFGMSREEVEEAFGSPLDKYLAKV